MGNGTKRKIDVRKQHRMSPGETWRLCLRGVKHRLFRSALTLAVVVLAVAFFMFLLSSAMSERAAAAVVSKEDAAARFAETTLSKMLTPATVSSLALRLAKADGEALDEMQRVTGAGPDEVAEAASFAKKLQTYLSWLENMPRGKRIVLVGRASGREALERLAADRHGMHEALSMMVDVAIPGKVAALDSFLDCYSAGIQKLSAFTSAWNETVRKAGIATDAAAGSVAVERWLPATDQSSAEAWRCSMEALGFSISPADLSIMRTRLDETNADADVLEVLSNPDLRREWAAAFREARPSTPEDKLALADDERATTLLSARGIPRTVAKGAAERHIAAKRMAELKEILAPVLQTRPVAFGLTGRQVFLLCISFLVCMVGIANAMLMAITERFREIATMKCLGATDGCILSLFMMEAALQGFLGGVLGATAGFLVAAARCATLYGSLFLRSFPAGGFIACLVSSVAVGILLSALASIQPSWSASRMAPMEAMRVE